MNAHIGEIAEMILCVPLHTRCEKIDQIFKENQKLQGVVVVRDNQPVGLVMRTRFYQQIGTLYGYNLYMGRSIELIMDRQPLVVEYSQQIIDVSKLAMNRAEEELYDYVIVTRHGQFAGIVSIRNLLLNFAEIQAEIASYKNPLTGLPGNHTIEEKLKLSIQQGSFSVYYIDLDHFKAYNDTYGFQMGDRLIQQTATILKNNVYPHDGFLGHIGGDDFIAIQYHHQFHDVCRAIISDFSEAIRHFYSEAHLIQQYVIAENRAGQVERIPLVSISIAVVTNEAKAFRSIDEIVHEATRLKKICKLDQRSCYYSNTLAV